VPFLTDDGLFGLVTHGTAEPRETQKPTGGGGRTVHGVVATRHGGSHGSRVPVRPAVQPVHEQHAQRSTVPAGRRGRTVRYHRHRSLIVLDTG